MGRGGEVVAGSLVIHCGDDAAMLRRGPGDGADKIGVSIVMPCLNEARCLPVCIANAQEALARIRDAYGLEGEIVVADNGSTDGSPEVAERLGARCAPVLRRGYGAALIGGAEVARGRYIVMGDADGSYDFCDAVSMVGKLVEGAELCMGSRFKGRIEPGAMPWKNRYIGNPALTGILNLLFRSGISDAHCGIRALTKSAFEQLRLRGEGMEFASEMVIKATLQGLAIAEVPATLSRDLRDRPPHLRPWRDGWRHLRYILTLSPAWVFLAPAATLALLSLVILGTALGASLAGTPPTIFGANWVILAGGLLTVSHTAAVLAAAGTLYGIREGYRRWNAAWLAVARWLSLETMLVVGAVCIAAGLGILSVLFGYWSQRHFQPIPNVLPSVIGTSLVVIGMQNLLGGFLLAIVNGNNATLVLGETRLDKSQRGSGRASPAPLTEAARYR